MKKNILKVALVAAFALFAGYSVYTSQKSVDLSALALDNVEALASNEWGDNNCHMNNATWLCTPWATGTGCYCYM